MSVNLEYSKPETLTELWAELKVPGTVILAGGTELLVRMRKNGEFPGKIVDLKNISDFAGVRAEKDTVSIGSLVTIQELKENPLIEKYFPALQQAAASFGCYEIRNRATIGGNVGRASPGAELLPGLYVYGAKVKLISALGERAIAIAEFISAPGKTALQPGEVIAGLKLPILENSISGYLRISRGAGMDLAAINGALLVLNPQNPEIRIVKIAFGGVAKTCDCPKEVEALLSKTAITAELIATAKTKLFETYSPRDTSLRATPFYKKKMLGEILANLLKQLGLLEE